MLYSNTVVICGKIRNNVFTKHKLNNHASIWSIDALSVSKQDKKKLSFLSRLLTAKKTRQENRNYLCYVSKPRTFVQLLYVFTHYFFIQETAGS